MKKMKKKITVVFRYDNFNDYIRDYVCWDFQLPKEGDIVYLLQNYGEVKSVEKLADSGGMERYLCRIIENNTECVKRKFNELLDDLLDDMSTCKTIAQISHVNGELTLEVDSSPRFIDQAPGGYPKDCIAFKLPWLMEYIQTDVEYSKENLMALKCVLMERFYKLKDVRAIFFK